MQNRSKKNNRNLQDEQELSEGEDFKNWVKRLKMLGHLKEE